MSVAALILAAFAMIVAPQGPQMESIQFRDMGHITYDTDLISDPKVERLYTVAEFVLDFVEQRCSPPCVLEPSMLDIDVFIVPYAKYEDNLLSILDMEDPKVAELIRGDGGLIDGHTQMGIMPPVKMYFYDNPPDTLFIHELLHVLYPREPEEIVIQRQLVILSSRAYKDWLRNNY